MWILGLKGLMMSKLAIIMAYTYSQTSNKQPPKMQRSSGRLWELVVYKNRTAGVLF